MRLCSYPGRQSRHWILPVPDYYGTRFMQCKFTVKVMIARN
nr:MAG TPA_asm: Mitochondrial import protein Pam17 [Caudoviricetes sp.]